MLNLKYFLVFLTSLSLSLAVQAQSCMADAGADQHWCRDNIADTIVLGGMPTAGNGTSPYTYEWSIAPIKLSNSLSFYASDFIDDTTKANPTLIDFWEHEIAFFLKVKDSNNLICTDTVRITASQFVVSLVTYSYNINAGDSVRLKMPNVGPSSSLMAPLDSVLWRPNIGLTDSNAIEPWVKPSKNVVYYSVVWDSAGCKAEGPPFQYVNVHHIGSAEFEEESLKVYPTLLDDTRNITVERGPGFPDGDFQLHNAQGTLVFEKALTSEKQEFHLKELSPGVYIYRIRAGTESLKHGKLLIR